MRKVKVLEVNPPEIEKIWTPVYQNQRGELEAVKFSQAPTYNPDGSRDVYVSNLRSVRA